VDAGEAEGAAAAVGVVTVDAGGLAGLDMQEAPPLDDEPDVAGVAAAEDQGHVQRTLAPGRDGEPAEALGPGDGGDGVGVRRGDGVPRRQLDAERGAVDEDDQAPAVAGRRVAAAIAVGQADERGEINQDTARASAG
jgi:hypothetical protein